MCQKKIKKVDSPELKIVPIHQYKYCTKNCEKRLITAASNSTENIRTDRKKKIENQNEKKTAVLTKSHTNIKKNGHGKKKGKLKGEPESLLIA